MQIESDRKKLGNEITKSKLPDIPAYNMSRREFLTNVILFTTASSILFEEEPPLLSEQDPLPPPPKYNPDSHTIQTIETIPPREVLVTEDDVKKAYDQLKSFRKGYWNTSVDRKESHILFSDTLPPRQVGYAWENQHPASALSTYKMIKGELPEGMPEPTDITACYWNDIRTPRCYLTRPNNYGDEAYIDDGAWFANIETDEYNLLQQKGDVTRAKFARSRASVMFQTAIHNREESNNGIFWIVQPDKNKDKAAVANGPVAALGTKLAKIDPDYQHIYIPEAQKIYTWMRQNLLNPETNLYADRTEKEGKNEKVIKHYPSYAQAHMIEAGLNLSELTGNSQYKLDAEKTAFRVLTQGDMYTNPTAYFDVLLLKSLYNMYHTTENEIIKSLIKDRIILYGNNFVRNKKYWNREEGKYKKRKPKVFESELQCQAAAAEILLITNAFKTPGTNTA